MRHEYHCYVGTMLLEYCRGNKLNSCGGRADTINELMVHMIWQNVAVDPEAVAIILVWDIDWDRSMHQNWWMFYQLSWWLMYFLHPYMVFLERYNTGGDLQCIALRWTCQSTSYIGRGKPLDMLIIQGCSSSP